MGPAGERGGAVGIAGAVLLDGNWGHAPRRRAPQSTGGAEGGRERRSGDGANDESAAWAPGAACVDEAHEAVALAARAACNLAAPLAWRVAADLAAGAVGGRCAYVIADSFASMVGCMGFLLRRAAQWWRPPLLLPPPQLLACQPQRLLAAACALVAVGMVPEGPSSFMLHLCRNITYLIHILASHRTLSGRVRSWLAPPPPPLTERSAATDTCAGCLVAPLLSAMQHAQGASVVFTAHTLALLRLAGGEVTFKAADTCGDGQGMEEEEEDGGFRRYALAVTQSVSRWFGDPSASLTGEPPLPDGLQPAGLPLSSVVTDGQRPPPPPLSAPSWPLPPPLALPPGWAGALTRLRMCGNPTCCNFGAEREGALPFKQCGGCRAVRYCGAGCQRAHWREGHRAECKTLTGAGVK